jgi:CheY-like chemotaxis protein
MELNNERSKWILQVDDDGDDLFLLGEAFREADPAVELRTATDGRAALALLEEAGAGLPHLIVLDINMPGMDGRETLNALYSHPQWSAIPVAMLSTSSNPRDKAYCESLNAAFFTKPLMMSGMRETARALLAMCREPASF